MIGDRDEAEDIVQAAFTVVHKRLAEFDRARPFPAWLFGIVRRIAERTRTRNARRKRLLGKWGAHTVDAPHAPAADVLLSARTRLEAVYDAMHILSPMQRACFELVAIRNVAPADAAAMHGISESTVRQHVFRARNAIRSAIGEDA
jgi:RNA polymerase sigma-70 factor (ECF subfamily)